LKEVETTLLSKIVILLPGEFISRGGAVLLTWYCTLLALVSKGGCVSWSHPEPAGECHATAVGHVGAKTVPGGRGLVCAAFKSVVPLSWGLAWRGREPVIVAQLDGGLQEVEVSSLHLELSLRWMAKQKLALHWLELTVKQEI